MYEKHGNIRHPVYVSWRGMRQRCLNPQSTQWKRYGGRGIKICPEWADFVTFYDWAITNGWAPGLTIDRLDCNGHYTPANCRWATAKEQSINRNSQFMIVYKGKLQSLRSVAADLGLAYNTLRKRHMAGDRGAKLLRAPDPVKSAASRGVGYAHPDDHAPLKASAARLARERAKRAPTRDA